MNTIKKFDLPQCPYCREKAWYIESFLAKNQKTYKCNYCDRTSEVNLKPETFKFLGIIEILSIAVFIIAIFLGSSFCLLGISVIVMLFTVFYVFSPFMVLFFRPRVTSSKDEDDFANMKKASGKDTDTEIYSN